MQRHVFIMTKSHAHPFSRALKSFQQLHSHISYIVGRGKGW